MIMLSGTAEVASLRFTGRTATVHDLSVEGTSSYFVCEDGVWVHNYVFEYHHWLLRFSPILCHSQGELFRFIRPRNPEPWMQRTPWGSGCPGRCGVVLHCRDDARPRPSAGHRRVTFPLAIFDGHRRRSLDLGQVERGRQSEPFAGERQAAD